MTMSWISRLHARAASSCAAYESKTIFIRISCNLFSKPRRVTRQVLIKTSVASALVAVAAFIVIYTAIIIATTSNNDVTLNGRPNYQDVAHSATGETHRRVKLLWSGSGKGRNRFQGRYSASDSDTGGSAGSSTRTLPSRDWGYDQLVGQNTIKPNCAQNLLLLAIITSAPRNRKQRDVIRETWCSPKALSANQRKCVFLIGGTSEKRQNFAVRQEALQHGDMLVGNYSDSYRNLTYKVVSGFHWTVYECKPKFILKTDDDCFVNMEILTPFLTLKNPEHDLYVGKVFMETKDLQVIRDMNSKWAVSTEDYPPELYPKYASGTGYLVSYQVAKRFLEVSRTYKPFPNEDAYVGVLIESLGISPIHSPRFTFVNTHWTMCNFIYLLVVHRISFQQQRDLTNLAQQALVKCSNQRFFDTWN